MNRPEPDAADLVLDWDGDAPVDRRFGDIYFSPQDGLAESRAVFLDGCGLPRAWAGRVRFTVAELGFGTGLNIAALLDLWRRTRPPGARLSIFSVEAYPLARADAARALGAWPQVAEAAQALLAGWPDRRRGFHRIDLEGFHAGLDLFVGDVDTALAAWSGPADAWFLDGFAPSKNPQMWAPEILAAVGRLSAPGAVVASFTVAGAVRRGLAAAGFEVAKRPGHGAKRERLEARRPSSLAVAEPRRAASALVIGGGIAGAALARAFALEGVGCTVIEAVRPGAGASGAPAALVTPRLDAGFGPAARLHAQAFARAVDLYHRETPDAIVAEGALQLSRAPRDAERFARLASWEGFAPGALDLVEAESLGTRLADPGATHTAPALRIADALVVETAAVLARWLAGAERRTGVAARLTPAEGGGWLCLDAEGDELARADCICVAAGPSSGVLVEAGGLTPVRGQLDFTAAPVFAGEAAAWGAYAIPLRRGGALWGASHRRGDAGADLRDAESEANLAALASRRPALATRIAALPPGAREAWAAVRAATPDHLPLAGGVEEGLALLAGLGGRGFTLAPLLAEHVVAGLLDRPSPLPNDLAARLTPHRFTGRETQTDAGR